MEVPLITLSLHFKCPNVLISATCLTYGKIPLQINLVIKYLIESMRQLTQSSCCGCCSQIRLAVSKLSNPLAEQRALVESSRGYQIPYASSPEIDRHFPENLLSISLSELINEI